eukprot:ctg_480.g157
MQKARNADNAPRGVHTAASVGSVTSEAMRKKSITDFSAARAAHVRHRSAQGPHAAGRADDGDLSGRLAQPRPPGPQSGSDHRAGRELSEFRADGRAAGGAERGP